MLGFVVMSKERKWDRNTRAARMFPASKKGMTPLDAYVPGSAPFRGHVNSMLASVFALSRVPAARRCGSAPMNSFSLYNKSPTNACNAGSPVGYEPCLTVHLRGGIYEWQSGPRGMNRRTN